LLFNKLSFPLATDLGFWFYVGGTYTKHLSSISFEFFCLFLVLSYLVMSRRNAGVFCRVVLDIIKWRYTLAGKFVYERLPTGEGGLSLAAKGQGPFLSE
jgi:hypothetical protein